MSTKSQEQISTQHLYQRSDLTPQVAHWIYNEFWTDVEGVTENDLYERFLEATNDQQMPLSLVAFLNDQPVGTASLIESDDDERLHLKPWLAALYVKPEYRGLSIGKHLVKEILKEAQKLHVKRLYLGTDKPDFYIKLGALVHEEARPGFMILYFDIEG